MYSNKDKRENEVDKSANNIGFGSTDKTGGILLWNKISNVYTQNTIKLNAAPNFIG